MDAGNESAPRRLSVIIANYNYARYLGEAISSALNLDWPDVEVIVVDNGSTDHSREVIAGFGDRVRSIMQANLGNLQASNAGFALSSGDVIYFLDADDIVEPHMMREVAAVLSPGVSKVQFQVRVIDARGRFTGDVYPHYHSVPSAAGLRRMATRIGNYLSPHTPGNVYARSYLERIFPLQPVAGNFSDSCCIAAAPFLGDVVTLPKALSRYRVHGANDGAMMTLDRERFIRMLRVSVDLFAYTRRMAASAGIDVRRDAIDRSLYTLALRVACLRLTPHAHPVPHDTRLRLARLLVGSLAHPQGIRGRHHATGVAWGLATLAAPAPWIERLVGWRFAPMTRPRLLDKALKACGVLKRGVI
jgi:glycosyltransferase involved in cell wall biosynthesis